jgi:hypothetical protein
VDGIENEHKDELIVLRINIQSPAGKALGSYFRATMTPTFIFFDSQGLEQWRSVGSIDRQRVEKFLSGAR